MCISLILSRITAVICFICPDIRLHAIFDDLENKYKPQLRFNLSKCCNMHKT